MIVDEYEFVSYYTTLDESGEYIIVQVDWDGKPSSAVVAFPVDAGPAIAHAILDQWNEATMLEDDDE